MVKKILVIVESPAKAKKIEGFLGSKYKVIASFGHLRTLPDLESVDIENGFTAKYSVIDEPMKKKQVEKLREEIADALEVILATDDDREGECIAWHICDMYGLPLNTRRIVFHEITEDAICRSILCPTVVNMDVVSAGKARQILDILIGYTISPALWNCIARTHEGSLSAGRCQTPTLRLVYDNHIDIQQSPGQLVYNTIGYFTSLVLPFELNYKYGTKEAMQQFLQDCKQWEFTYSVSQPKKSVRRPPQPLTTSALQQIASNELHITPKDTMKYAQQLYEAGYITYMRTDSKKFSKEFLDTAKNFIIETYGEQYVSAALIESEEKNATTTTTTKTTKPRKTTKPSEKPKPQEAHEAIRPVNLLVRTPELNGEIQAKAIKLYELIWKHTIGSCMAAAQYNIITSSLSAPDNKEFQYKSEQVVFKGWQIIDPKMADSIKGNIDNNIDNDAEPNNQTNYTYLRTLAVGSKMNFKKIDSKFTLTNLKSHLTEARLVHLLEEKGIGRPSTFASLVDKIQERKYVLKQDIEGKTIECEDYSLSSKQEPISKVVSSRQFGNEKGKLVIQPLGILVSEFLDTNFNEFFNYDYTSEMEQQLDNISKSLLNLQQVCGECWTQLCSKMETVKHLKRFELEIEPGYSLIVGKYGPVVKHTTKDSLSNKDLVTFIPVKKDIDIHKLQTEPSLRLEDIVEPKKQGQGQQGQQQEDNKPIGKFRGKDLWVKEGRYGIYAQWGTEKQSLKELYSGVKLENVTVDYMAVIRFLERDNLLDPKKPVGLVRELTPFLSIRTGKYGDYIYYKKPRDKKPQFLKLQGFKLDYKTCDKDVVVAWITETYLSADKAV